MAKNDPKRVKAPPPFDVATLLSWVARETGEDDVGYLDGEALHALCDSLAECTELHFIGRSRAQRLLVQNLIKRVRLRQYMARHPEISEIQITRPVFLIAPPRTGTTFLHRLLAQDPAARATRLWEAMLAPPAEPALRGDPAYFEQDYRVALSRKAIAARKRFSAALETIHPSGVDLPEECWGLLEATMLSHSYMFYGPVTSYLDWLTGRTHEQWVEACRIYADQVRLLQWWYPGQFWVLKNPFLICAVDAIYEVFPDAVIVQQNRDAGPCAASLSSLLAAAYKPLMLNVDNERVGALALRYLTEVVARNVTARAKLPAERFVDIDYPQLLADPMGCAERVYAAADRELTPGARDAMAAYIAGQKKSGKHHGHAYTLEDYGLDEHAVEEAFAAYGAIVGKG